MPRTLAPWLIKLFNQSGTIPLALVVGTLLVFLRTMVPTLYTFDSPEFVTGAYTLGFVHAPGYPFYLIILHLFLKLPVGDIAMRGNILSALMLACTAPFVFWTLCNLIGYRRHTRPVALSVTVLGMVSYYVWLSGLFTEIYAFQNLTVMITLYSLSCFTLRRTSNESNLRLWTPALVIGSSLAFGLAVAAHPSSALFGLGLAVAFLVHRVPFRWCVMGGLISVTIAVVPLLYFPIRFAASPTFSIAGQYNAQGLFSAEPLNTWQGVLWMISGRQFDSLFFSDGFLPSFSQLGRLFSLFFGEFLGFGVLVGVYGIWIMRQHSTVSLLTYWIALFIPVTYFYTTYNAPDVDTMFGPSFLLWTIPLAFGLRALIEGMKPIFQFGILILLPLTLFLVNFPLVDLHDQGIVRVRAENILKSAPPDAIVFANWGDITPLVYLQKVEGERPDIRLITCSLSMLTIS